jgi:hypothetical protein
MVNLKRFEPFALIDTARAATKFIAILAYLWVVAGLAGCVQPPVASAPANAQQALERIVRDYETGNLKTLEASLPASFVGRDSLLDAARRAANDQRNVRVEIAELRTQTTGAAQALTFRWEKRFIRASSGAQVTERGSMQTVMRKSGEAWLIENLPADNLFTR